MSYVGSYKVVGYGHILAKVRRSAKIGGMVKCFK